MPYTHETSLKSPLGATILILLQRRIAVFRVCVCVCVCVCVGVWVGRQWPQTFREPPGARRPPPAARRPAPGARTPWLGRPQKPEKCRMSQLKSMFAPKCLILARAVFIFCFKSQKNEGCLSENQEFRISFSIFLGKR